MSSFVSAKLTSDFFIFLKKFQINRIRSNNTDEPESMAELCRLIVLFFKKNPEQYNRLLKEKGRDN